MQDADWEPIRLAVFGMDGTLHDLGRLRWRMAREMAAHAARTRSLRALRVIARHRRLREELADAGALDAPNTLVLQTAAVTGVPADQVRQITQEWREQRPLRHLAAGRHAHVAALMDGMRRAGLTIAVWSDDPVTARLAALGLAADYAVWAGDPGVGVLKPNPAGLLRLMALAGVGPAQTVLIGGRPDRDGEAARRAGVRALIKASKPWPGWECFAAFDDAVFARFLR